MDMVPQPVATRPPAKLRCVLLMDSNAERRASRKKTLALHGIEAVGVSDLTEASSIRHRDRYDLVLIDIRRDHYGCLAWRDMIKQESPKQIVAFLVGEPRYIDLEPQLDSYVAEEHGSEWGSCFVALCARLATRCRNEMVSQRLDIESQWKKNERCAAQAAASSATG